MTIKKRTARLTVLILILSLGLFVPSGVSAASGGQSTSANSGACGTSFYRGKFRYMVPPEFPLGTCEDAGISFAYFEYDVDYEVDISMGPTNDKGGGTVIIKGSECLETGGFYHLGYTDIKDDLWWYSGDGTEVHINSTSNNYPLSIGNPNMRGSITYSGNWDSALGMGHGIQEIYVDGKLVAHLVGFVDKSTASQHYEQWRKYSGWPDEWEGGLNSFCWGEGLSNTTFWGSIDGYVNGSYLSSGSTKTIHDNSALVRFNHTIHRNNDGEDKSIGTKYSVGGDLRTRSESKVSLYKGSQASPHMTSNDEVYVSPGQSKTLQQTLYYDATANSKTSWDSTSEGPYTMTIYRPSTGDNAINGWTKARVNNKDTASGDKVTVGSDGKYTISFQHTLRRGSDAAGGTVDANWSTSVYSKDSAGRTVNPGGTARRGTQTLSQNQEANVVSYNTETFSGTLLPGETRTFCQTLTYDHNISYPNNKSRSASEYCVNVYREPAEYDNKCKIEKQPATFGVNSGENIGRLTLRKRNDSPLDTQPQNTGDHSVKVYAKPSDWFSFSETMCEGAEMANQYHETNKPIEYRIEATRNSSPSNAIMRGSIAATTPTRWTNVGIKSRNFAGVKDIWNGSDYQESNTSPASGRHDVAEDDAGKTFKQILTWTDLWMTNGKEVAAHNGSSKATATGIVEVPYNYINIPHVDRDNGIPVSPGKDLEITVTIDTEPRKNTPVNGDEPYKTKTKESAWQIISYTVDDRNKASDEVTTTNEYYNGAGDLDLSQSSVCGAWMQGGNSNTCKQASKGSGIVGENPIGQDGQRTNIYVPDGTPVGTKVCAVAAVWPADSHNSNGATADITSEEMEQAALDEGEASSGTQRAWKISQPTCVTVAKRPTIQVRMSGAYAENRIDTSTTSRGPSSDTTAMRRYGSWADYDLVSGDETLGMASGAAFWGGLPLSDISLSDMTVCKVSSLTFTNNECANHSGNRVVGNFGSQNKSLASYPGTAYERLRSRYAIEANEYTANDLGGFTVVANNLASEDSSYGAKVIYHEGTLNITGDIRYEDKAYANIDELPQAIIIADTIRIAPNVTHLDAWLVADSIDTCYVAPGTRAVEYPGPSDNEVSVRTCPHQLTVTGPVITKQLQLNRTYGGDGGQQSNSEAAEIFKLSPITYLWSYAETQRYSQAVTTYQRELPTRY
ncbi:hypothetical protein IJ102_00505 [Candidatus Saccharibacteria bacterium]|nr:hypothetical protein [Candidatus Saccharibacteria bacterium]